MEVRSGYSRILTLQTLEILKTPETNPVFFVDICPRHIGDGTKTRGRLSRARSGGGGEAPAPHLKQAKPVPLGAGFGPSPLSTAASNLRFTFCGTRLWKRGPGPRSTVTPADGSAGRSAPGTIGFPPCPRNRPPERPGPEPGGGWTRFWF